MSIREAFPDVPVIDLTGGAVRQKAQGSIDLSASPSEEVVEEETADAAAPTSSAKKQEIFDYLVARGEDPSDLDGLTKAELLELV